MTVTMRSTKEAIFKAFQEAQAELERLRSNRYDPLAEEEKCQSTVVLEEAHQTLASGFEQRMKDLETDVTSLIRQISNVGFQRLKEFENLQAAIHTLQERITKLTGIESEVLDLVTVVNAREDLIQRLDQERAKLKEDIEQARVKWENEKKVLQQEWDDEFERHKRKKFLDLEESLDKEKREFEKWMADSRKEIEEVSKRLNERQKLIEDQESEIEELRKEVSLFEYRLKAAREEEAEKTRQAVKIEFENHSRIMQTQYESKIELLQSKIDLLTSEMTKKDEEIADLKKKLDDAYARIENIAVKQSEAQRPNFVVQNPANR